MPDAESRLREWVEADKSNRLTTAVVTLLDDLNRRDREDDSDPTPNEIRFLLADELGMPDPRCFCGNPRELDEDTCQGCQDKAT